MKKIILTILITVIAAVTLLLVWNFRMITAKALPRPGFDLHDAGNEKIVQYEKYGKFVNEGKVNYGYVISDRRGLADAVGEGIYPNTSVYRDPLYKRLLGEGKLKGDHWKYLYVSDDRVSFYKWATANEAPGVKQFYTALTLENAGLISQAIKAYYAVLIHFPKTVSFTYWNTPWYPAKAAIDKIRYLTAKYPLLGMRLEGASVLIENGFNLDPVDDIYYVNPGRITKCRPYKVVEKQNKRRLGAVLQQIGYGKVNLLQYKGGDWQLMVDDKPFIMKGIAYLPTKIGESPDEGTLVDWTKADYNEDGLIDGPYEAWVDENLNDIREENEVAIGDFRLMKDMGVNTIRIYDHELNANKKLLRELYERYGIMVIMGDLLGTYAVGSGASWYRGTNYSDPEHKEKLKKRVRKMVEEYKNEPYILMWMLGNETNYGVANSAKRFPAPFYEFANEIAKMIKEIDYNHPIALCNGDTLYLDMFAKYCPDVDVFGANSYRGWQGFGFWDDIKRLCDKPVIITEYGAPAYWENYTREEAEEAQSEYHEGSWNDIFYNTAGYGCGNVLGGIVFEWADEWWKAYEPALQDTHKQWSGPVKGGWIYEEWFGLCSQGRGFDSPRQRQLRKSYFTYKRMWNPTISEQFKKMWYNMALRFMK